MKTQIIKIIGTSLVATLLTISVAQAEGFGTYSSDVAFEQNLDDSMSAIEKSRALRKSLSNDRSIAGMSSSDQKWTQEFERIMSDNRTDYLKKAYQIND